MSWNHQNFSGLGTGTPYGEGYENVANLKRFNEQENSSASTNWDILSASRPLKNDIVKSPICRPGTEAPTTNINISIWNSTLLKYVKLAEAEVRRP